MGEASSYSWAPGRLRISRFCCAECVWAQILQILFAFAHTFFADAHNTESPFAPLWGRERPMWKSDFSGAALVRRRTTFKVRKIIAIR